MDFLISEVPDIANPPGCVSPSSSAVTLSVSISSGSTNAAPLFLLFSDPRCLGLFQSSTSANFKSTGYLILDYECHWPGLLHYSQIGLPSSVQLSFSREYQIKHWVSYWQSNFSSLFIYSLVSLLLGSPNSALCLSECLMMFFQQYLTVLLPHVFSSRPQEDIDWQNYITSK